MFVLAIKHLKQDLWKQKAVGQYPKIKNKKLDCKQVKDFLRCEGKEKGEWEETEKKIRGRWISRDSGLVKSIYLKKIRGREVWERLIHFRSQP